MNFLEKIAEFVYQHRQSTNTANILMLFPSKRAIGMFEHYLMQYINVEATISPYCVTIDDFFHIQSNYAIADEILQLNILHQLHNKINKVNQAFYEFLPWGKLILKDFNEIDKYLINTNNLFNDIIDYKTIETTLSLDDIAKEYLYLFSNAIEVDNKQILTTEFIKTWKILGQLYEAFNEALALQSYTYSGKCYRNFINTLETEASILPYDAIYFCGFNAFTIAEEKLLDLLKAQQTVYTFWDIDEQFMRSKIHEAGNFLRQYYLKYNNEHLDFWIVENNKLEQQIYIKNIASNVGQMYHAITETKQLKDKTAIVLCDEQLLDVALPFIDFNLFNITMGFSIKQSVSYRIIYNFIELIQQANKDGNNISINSKYIIYLLTNNEIEFIWSRVMPYQSLPYYTNINSLNKFIKDDFILNINIFYNGIDFGNYILKILDILYNIEPNIIYEIKKQIEYINHIVQEQVHLQEIENYCILVLEQLQTLSIPFTTLQTAPIQIMGFLETRLLDFDNLYIISMNDDKMPGTNRNNSFIPFHLRKAFGMPTFDQFDGINAYHFYRLIKRSKNVHLIYNSAMSDNMSEESRFIRQIKLNNKNNINLVNLNISSSEKSNNDTVEIKKTATIKSLLQQIEFSATAIQLYLNSPIDFYFSYILKLKAPKNKQFELDAASFGTLLHNTLEYYYNQPKNTISINNALQAILDEEQIVIKNLSGDHQLQIEIIKNICNKIIQKDKEENFTIISNEAKLKHNNFVLNNEITICLKGKVDRIDKLENNIIRIIDYKTGNETLKAFPKPSKDEEKTKSNIDDFFKAIFSRTNSTYKATFQGLLYAYLYKQNNPDAQIIVGFYLAKALNNGIQYLNNGNIITDELLQLFEQHLKQLLQEIFDINTPFTIGKNEKYQSYSEYINLLN